MKAINTLIGRFVLAVGLLAVAEAGLSQSATLAETKEFLSRKLLGRQLPEANNHGDPCFLYGYRLDMYEIESSPGLHGFIINLSTIYLDGIGGPLLGTPDNELKLRTGREAAINHTKDVEYYFAPHGLDAIDKLQDALDMRNWKRVQHHDDGQIRVMVSSDLPRVIQAIKHAARLCGAKDVTPQLQFE